MCFFFFFLFMLSSSFFLFFFFNDTATTEIYTLSLHDALPIYARQSLLQVVEPGGERHDRHNLRAGDDRSEEHTSELQSPCNLVCRLLLEKKKKKNKKTQSLAESHAQSSTVVRMS